MIRIVIVGFSLLFFSACRTYSVYRPYGKVLQEFDNFYINDSLSVSYQFPADYVETKGRTRIKTKLKHFQLQNWRKYLLGYFTTTIPPQLEHFTFFIPFTDISKVSKYGLSTDSCILDTLKHMLYKFQSVNKTGILIMVASSSHRDFSNLKNEYLDKIFTSIKTGNNFEPEIHFDDPFSLVSKISLNSDSTVNYLLPLTQLISSKAKYKESSHENTYIQALATYYSFINNSNIELNTLVAQWRAQNYMSKRDDSDLHIGYYDNDAINELVRKCRDQQVVMINENHFLPNHRLLIHLLLDRLYLEGFRYFGVEGLWENGNVINKRKFCTTSSGFYTRAPSMSNLINYAIEAGYNVFGYDDFSEQRELNQARNIYNTTHKTDSNAKVLVLAGFGHISERKSSKSMMAAEFYDKFNINPLTIDQCEFDLQLGSHFLGLIDTVNLGNKKKLLADIYLTNQLTDNEFSKLMGFSRYEIPIDAQYKYPSLLSVYNAENYSVDKTVIPVFNYILDQTNKQKIQAYLPPQNYIFKIKTRTNKLLRTDTLKVN